MARTEEISDSGSTAAEVITTFSRRELAVLVAKTVLKNPAAIVRFWVMSPGEERYVRPPRPYELPAFHDSMRHCTSDEKYLRPTLFCNPREPVVIAMANELGAYEKTDYEFAEAANEFITHNMTLSVCPFADVGTTLKRGTGSCYNLMSVFVALCRAAGIKARYRGVKRRVIPEERQEAMLSLDPFYGEIYGAMADVSGQSEACIDGVWMGVDLIASPEMQAVRGLPIKNLGEGLMASETVNDPSQEWHSESMPRFAARGMTMLRWLAPAMYQRINVGILRQYALGRKIIEEAGGIEAYNQRARKKWGLTSRITELEHDKAIVFED
jgi:hypothetical protein